MKKIELLLLTFLTLFFGFKIHASEESLVLKYSEYKKLTETDKLIYIKNITDNYYEFESKLVASQNYKISHLDINIFHSLINQILPESVAGLDDPFYSPKVSCLIGGSSIKKDKNGVCKASGRKCTLESDPKKSGFQCGKIYRNICVERTDNPADLSKSCHLTFNKALNEGKMKDLSENEYARFSHHLTHFDRVLCKDVKESDSQFEACILFRKRLSQTNYSISTHNGKNCFQFKNDNKSLFDNNKIESYVKTNKDFINDYHSKKDTIDKLCENPKIAEFQKNAVLLQDYNGTLYLPYAFQKNDSDYKLVTNGEIKTSHSTYNLKNKTFSSFPWDYCGYKVLDNPSCEDICKALRSHKANNVAKNSVESCLHNSADCFKIPFENIGNESLDPKRPDAAK